MVADGSEEGGLPNEAHTDLPVAASNMGCFLAILTLM